jgi:hypothetical protein
MPTNRYTKTILSEKNQSGSLFLADKKKFFISVVLIFFTLEATPSIAQINNSKSRDTTDWGGGDTAEWDSSTSKWIPATGSQDRPRAIWDGYSWKRWPSIKEEVNINSQVSTCVSDRIKKMKTDAAVTLLRRGCNLVAWSFFQKDENIHKDAEWLAGRCLLSRITGTEPDAAISVLVSSCNHESRAPTLKQKLDLCVSRGRC